MQVEDQFFPPLWPASICMGKLDYNAQMDKITNLVKELDQLDQVELPFEETWVAALPPNASLYDFVTSPAGRPFAMFFNISEEDQEFEGEVFSFFGGPAVTMVVLRVIVEDMLINVACTFLAIVVSNYIHEINTLPVEEEKD